MITPVATPLGPVEALDKKYQCKDAWRNRGQPVIKLISIIGRRCQQLDHGTETAFRMQWLAAWITVLVFKTGLEALRVVLVKNCLHLVQVLLQVIYEQGTINNRIIQGF